MTSTQARQTHLPQQARRTRGGGVPTSNRPGDTLADRYRLDDLLSESGSGRFWCAHDRVLQRAVALHVIGRDDARAAGLLDAARRSATVVDPRILRVLDAQVRDAVCFVVNEWGHGTSLDIALANNGPLIPRRAAWLVGEVAESVAVAHAQGVHHGRLVPENVLIDSGGAVRIIGFAVDAALHGLPAGDEAGDLHDLGGLLHACLTGRWAGDSLSGVPAAPREGRRVLRPRQVRAGVPRQLDTLVDDLLHPATPGPADGHDLDAATAAERLADFVGDPIGIPASLAAANPLRTPDAVVLDQVPDIALRAQPGPRPEPRPERPEGREPAARHDDPVRSRTEYFTSLYAGPPPSTTPSTTPDAGPGSRSTVDEDTSLWHDDFSDTDDGDLAPATGGVPPAADPSPLPEPPVRPLFASEVHDDAESRRRARVERAARSGSLRTGDTDPSSSSTSVTRPVGPRAVSPLVLDDGTDADGTDGAGRPGRRSLQAAAAVGLAILLLVVAAVVWSSVSAPDSTSAGPAPTLPSTGTAPAVGPTIEGVQARVFDPGGAPGRAGDGAELAVDGSSATAWSTGTFAEQLDPAGPRTGVGLILDTGSETSIGQVDLTMVGSPTQVVLYVLQRVPDSLSTVRAAAELPVGQRQVVDLPRGTTGRFVVVWLTQLPQVGSDFRGGIVSVALRG